MSLLTICQDAADIIGIQRPSTVVGNTNADARSLLAFAREELESLVKSFDWPMLIRLGEAIVFQDTADFNLTRLAIETDLDRFVSDTMWDRDERRQVDFPQTGKNFAFWNGTDLVFPAVNRRARLSYGLRSTGDTPTFGLAIEFAEPFGQEDVGKIFYYEYITNRCIDSSTSPGEPITSWAHDNDTCILTENIIRMGVVWRYQANKALPYAKSEQKYRMELEKAKAAAKAAKSLQMSPSRSGDVDYLLGVVPDHGYG